MSQVSTTSLRPPPPSPSVTTPPSGSFSPADASRNAPEHMSPSTKHGLAITLGIVCTAFGLLMIWAIWRFWQNFWFTNRVSGTKRRKKRMFWRTKTAEGGGIEAGIPEEKEDIEEVTSEKKKEAENMSASSSRLFTPPRLPALIWTPRRNSSRSKHQHDDSPSSPPPYMPASPSLLDVSSSSPSPPPFPAVATSSTLTSRSSQNQNLPPPNPFFTPLPPPLPRKPHQRSPRNSIISSLHPNYYYQSHSYSSGSMERDVPVGRGQNRVGRSPLSVSSSSGIPSDYEVEEEEDDKEREDDNSADSTQEGQSFGNGNVHTHIYMKPSQLGVCTSGNGNGNSNGHSRRSSCSFSGSMMLNTILEGGGNGSSGANEHGTDGTL